MARHAYLYGYASKTNHYQQPETSNPVTIIIAESLALIHCSWGIYTAIRFLSKSPLPEWPWDERVDLTSNQQPNQDELLSPEKLLRREKRVAMSRFKGEKGRDEFTHPADPA